MQRHFDKYGENNFCFEVVEYCEKNKLIEREQYYINLLNPKMNICKTCGCEHDGSYGSGIFCSKHCRYVYIGKQNKHPVCNFPDYIKKHNPDKIIN
jgi:group I intron endonuclease